MLSAFKADISSPLKVLKKTHQLLTEKTKEIDKSLLDKLEEVGFRLEYGEENTGWQFKYLTRGGGYYFNVGASDLIAERKIKVIQFLDIINFFKTPSSLVPIGFLNFIIF